MMKSRKQMLSEKAHEERLRARDWLLPYMKNDFPKLATKEELRTAAMRELGVSKLSFDFAWIMAIEETARYDWYEPFRLKKSQKSRN